jgi:hypothetical protein
VLQHRSIPAAPRCWTRRWFAGKIVVCDRGITARVNKSLAVQEAGGVGMILLNPPRAAAR